MGIQMKGWKKVRYVIMLLVIVILIVIWSITVEAEESNLEEWRDYIEIVAGQYGICPELVEAVIERESSWQPDAVNGTCIGLMQINLKYHTDRMERLGVEDLRDPYDNILVGTDFLAELFRAYENIYAVLMYYNAGYDGLRSWRAGQYSDYAIEVSERAAELEREHGK